MKNAPIYYALAQIKFNTISTMHKFVEDIQDSLRLNGYPVFETHQISEFVMAGDTNENPSIRKSTDWLFVSADKRFGYILTSSSITFHTTDYQSKEHLLAELIKGVKTIHEVATLDHVSRIGLRYLDAVLPTDNNDGDHHLKYLVEVVHGLTLDQNRMYSLTESVFTTESGPLIDNGILVSRVHHRNDHLGYPPDLEPRGLVNSKRFDLGKPVRHSVIDTDHFVEGYIPLDFDLIGQQILNLQQTMKSVFDKTITEHALNKWQ
jgi:uncharacterized protein (TIGR04255 family)